MIRIGNLGRNFGVKAVAVFLASIIWVAVSAQRRERTQDRTFDVPIALVGVPRNLIITTPLPDSVNVRLRGRITQIRSISSQDLEAILDLSGAEPGEFDLAITPQSINTPPDIEIVSIDPARISVKLERRQQRIVPIRPYPVGSVPDGYMVAEITVNPENALVSGPESIIRDVTEVVTERIVLSGRTAPFRKTVGLVADHPLIRVETPSAQVTVVVVAKPRVPSENAPDDANAGDG